MILRRSVILALGSMSLLPGGVFSQTAVKARRVGLLSSGAETLGLTIPAAMLMRADEVVD